jgi:flagellar M-ring protein FliF
VDRITLALMVDGIDEVGADGKHTWHARPQADLEQIERLAKSAIGFDEKRGDHVDVVSMPFINPIDPSEPESAIRPERARRDLVGLLEAVVLGGTAFALILLMTRSIINGLKPPEMGLALGAPALAGPLGEHPGGVPGGPAVLASNGVFSGAAKAAAAGPRGELAALTDESTVSLDQVEGQLRASSIRQLIDLAARHPDTTLTIIRGWMASEHG